MMGKTEIDNMSYEEMLRLWRFAPIGDSTFSGETGDYFTEVLQRKKTALKPGEHTMISKRIGWN